jgi:hypothetical protein
LYFTLEESEKVKFFFLVRIDTIWDFKIEFILFAEQVVYGRQFIGQAGDNLTNVSLFEEHCEHLFCDLICLSLNRFDKVMF